MFFPVQKHMCLFLLLLPATSPPRLYAFLDFLHWSWHLPSSWHFNVNPPGVHSPLSRDTPGADGANGLAHIFWFIAKTKLPDCWLVWQEKEKTVAKKNYYELSFMWWLWICPCLKIISNSFNQIKWKLSEEFPICKDGHRWQELAHTEQEAKNRKSKQNHIKGSMSKEFFLIDYTGTVKVGFCLGNEGVVFLTSWYYSKMSNTKLCFNNIISL